ncbi:unnamed protein product [Peronospora belbahrii]|uniref:Protein kinase domain-containing protein n=1 Tax=Peronospora belbahrii TaxID=622444 RepID=A0ABN8CKB6_9STRA|nr:unnamed protein product [Peronospora belbahrii]
MGSSDTMNVFASRKLELERLAADDFEIIRVLSVGTYGIVKLAKHKPTGISVALKVLSKERVISIYLPGGELWNLVYSHTEGPREEVDTIKTATQLRAQHYLKDDSNELRPATPIDKLKPTAFQPLLHIQSRTIKAEEMCVLRSQFGGLKEKWLLYRDLKLENLVLNSKGYVKIVNFGFAKMDAQRTKGADDSLEQTRNARNLTLCGSMDYMAPEVLLRQPHDQRVDIWSFGINHHV